MSAVPCSFVVRRGDHIGERGARACKSERDDAMSDKTVVGLCGDATARSSFDGEGRSKLANKRRVAVLGDDAVLLVTPPPALTDGKAALAVLGRENAGSDLV